VTHDVQGAIDWVHTWARYWLREQHGEGHALLRSTLIWTALSPASDPGAGLYGLPMFGDDDVGAFDYDDEKGAKLVKMAIAGDVDADAVLCGFAFQFIIRKRQMPSSLGSYIMGMLWRGYMEDPPRRRGGNKYANRRRDVFIFGAISRLKALGFHPTRNEATDSRESGCSIVAKALKLIGMDLGEAGVEEVWRNREAFKPPEGYPSVRE
jgi:hypothetical protein